MKKGKHRQGSKGHTQRQDTSGSPSAGTSATHSGHVHHTHVNRTRSKLPTKRKLRRQETNPETIPPQDEFELIISIPRNSPSRSDMNGRRSRGGFGGNKGGPDHASHGNKSKGFSMKEEALNTNDNYYSRSWMEDQRSTLRYQGITFVQSGELFNSIPTSLSQGDEAKSSHSDPPTQAQETVVSVATETEMNQSRGSSSHSSGPPITEQRDDEYPSIVEDGIIHPESISSLSRVHGTSSKNSISDSSSVSRRPSNPPISNPSVPLPPVQFISTEENIVFTPRNQRRKRNHPAQPLTSWEVPADFKAMTQNAAPDWKKPHKEINRRAGHKQYRQASSDEGKVERLSPIDGLPMTITAEDALRDYLENIRAQEEDGEGDDVYIDLALGADDVGVTEMKGLSLDDKGQSRSTDNVEPLEHSNITQSPAKSALSDSASPRQVDSPEVPGSVNPVAFHDSEVDAVESENVIDQFPPVVRASDSEEDNTWFLNPALFESENEASDDESNVFDPQHGLLGSYTDPIWNTDSEDPQHDQRQHNPDDSNDDDNEEDEEEGEEEEEEEEIDEAEDGLDEDEEIIANMNLENYDHDVLDFYPPSTRFAKKSPTRQSNVPSLPAMDEDIASHLQAIWESDRETKKKHKQDREKARLLGLLGNKSKSNGKKSKRAARQEEMGRIYDLEVDPLGIDIRKINDQMRAFWEDDDATDFAMPPMNQLARKICHNLAHAYNLSSKSHGSGSKRFTTLFKTTSTADTALEEHKINAIIKRATRMGVSEKSGEKWSGSNSPHRVKRHKDGDIVGGDAKEIASDNRGRVMLEKLGWRSGMGLGAEGMGMKLPVFAVVKASKSGLQ